MKSLVYTAPQKVEVLDKPTPEPKEGQVRIKVSYCGICGSDIGIYSGKHPRAKAPLILGHEFIGTIDKINNCSGKFNLGDRVCAYPLISCGHCFPCENGTPHVCQTLKLIGIDIDGGIAEYVCCDEDVLFKLDDDLSDIAASVIEPLAVIIRTMHQSNFKTLDTVTITGAGPIGILTAIVLKHSGASRIFISDIDENRLKICKDMGFETINFAKTDIIEYINAQTNNVGTDIVFECSGAEISALQMTKLCRIGGTICMTGVHKIPHAVNLQDLNFKEQTLVGSRVYTKQEFGQAVEYAKEIEKELESVVTHILPIEKSENVFDLINDKNEITVKVLIKC